MFVAFLGCDGSGKSAVIAGVSERLEAAGIAAAHGHWRPQVFGGEGGAGGADDPHGQALRGMVSSVLKLGWLWLNWWLGWWKFLRRASKDGVVLFDRYHVDLLVDPWRYRYGGPMWLGRLASRMMPQPNLVVFLDAEPDVLLSRKQEVSREALERSRAAYLKLADSRPRQVRIIDASQSLEVVVEAVYRSIGESVSR